MKYSLFGVFAFVGLSACTTVPGAVHDAAQTSSAVVNGGVGVGASVLDGAANVVVNAGRDVSNTLSGVANAVVPNFYYFP